MCLFSWLTHVSEVDKGPQPLNWNHKTDEMDLVHVMYACVIERILWSHKNRVKSETNAGLGTSASGGGGGESLCEGWWQLQMRCETQNKGLKAGSRVSERGRLIKRHTVALELSTWQRWVNFSSRLSGMLIRLYYFQPCFTAGARFVGMRGHRFNQREVEGSLSIIITEHWPHRKPEMN